MNREIERGKHQCRALLGLKVKHGFHYIFFCNLGFQIKMQKKNKMFTSKVL